MSRVPLPRKGLSLRNSGTRSGETSGIRVTISDEQLLPPGSRLTLEYYLLSVIAFGAMGLLLFEWFSVPGALGHPIEYTLFSLVMLYYCGAWSGRWLALRRMARPIPIEPESGLRVAVVTTFVPGSEPIRMLEQTLKALVGLDYPHDTWVLDEGDDPQVQALCHRVGSRYFTRKRFPQYLQPAGPFAIATKHGNYNAWLAEDGFDQYDILVSFDPDHVPERSYLIETLGYFRDPGIAYVQASPVFYNQPASFIARGAAEEGYDYYSSHQMASYALGHPIVVGSHSLHRVDALQQVGGFPDHDAEDLYLTAVYRANGWRGTYVPRVLALGTNPVNWEGYLRQQIRWARAVVDLKLRVLPRLSSRLSPGERVLNWFHGVYYLRPALMVPVLLLLISLVVRGRLPALNPSVLLVALGAFLLLHGIDRFRQRFYLDSRSEAGLHWRAMVLRFAKWPHVAWALVDALRGRRQPYKITEKLPPKRGRKILALPHLAVAGVIVLTMGFGVLRHGRLPEGLWVISGVLVAASLGVAWTERWDYPSPFDPEMLNQRRAELSGVGGEAVRPPSAGKRRIGD